jgi:hypothetical protein
MKWKIMKIFMRRSNEWEEKKDKGGLEESGMERDGGKIGRRREWKDEIKPIYHGIWFILSIPPL